MKRLLFGLFVVIGFSTTGFAQSVTVTSTDKVTKKQNVAANNKTAPVKKESSTKPATSATMAVKKDGTLDMRYKENKDAKKNKPHLKKDGSPDMRYKGNKKQ
jgi:hypothetical protein